ncbi:hypothetical protein HPP92_015153 [Vanilla planifolia]|uniref:cysteine dioxygenase n=1 Tax=Vanilla planifolia TaxID=51239 RepID=A0A835QX81_VANPL|nr:hypothetical protein HPP92_015153 [Vanilla planifolia]
MEFADSAMGEITQDEKGIPKRRRGQGKGEQWGAIGRPPRRRRVVAEESSAIQRIFEVSRAIFRGPGTVPMPEDVQLLQLLLDKMKPEDVGLSTDLLFFKNSRAGKGTPIITYTNIYTCDSFSMCIFFLPPTAVIPLHNHPGMTVFSKLLLGSIHIKSYDWVNNNISEEEEQRHARIARVVEDSDFCAPCTASVLYPTTGGNIHSFRANSPCALLDILGPPYSKVADRDCTYYRERSTVDGSRSAVGSVAWLEEMDIPKELKVDGIEYMGPRIVDDGHLIGVVKPGFPPEEDSKT